METQYILNILIIFIITYLFWRDFFAKEKFDSFDSKEAIQNISSIYNSEKLKANEIKATKGAKIDGDLEIGGNILKNGKPIVYSNVWIAAFGKYGRYNFNSNQFKKLMETKNLAVSKANFSGVGGIEILKTGTYFMNLTMTSKDTDHKILRIKLLLNNSSGRFKKAITHNKLTKTGGALEHTLMINADDKWGQQASVSHFVKFKKGDLLAAIKSEGVNDTKNTSLYVNLINIESKKL
jgi:hypothetical protein